MAGTDENGNTVFHRPPLREPVVNNEGVTLYYPVTSADAPVLKNREKQEAIFDTMCSEAEELSKAEIENNRIDTDAVYGRLFVIPDWSAHHSRAVIRAAYVSMRFEHWEQMGLAVGAATGFDLENCADSAELWYYTAFYRSAIDDICSPRVMAAFKRAQQLTREDDARMIFILNKFADTIQEWCGWDLLRSPILNKLPDAIQEWCSWGDLLRSPEADTAASPESTPHSVTGESVGSVGVSFILFFTLSIF